MKSSAAANTAETVTMPPLTASSTTTELQIMPHTTSPRALLRFDTVVADTQKVEEQLDNGPTATQAIVDINIPEDDNIQPQHKKRTHTLLPVGMDFKFTIHTQGSPDAPQYTRFYKGLCFASKPTFADLQQMIWKRYRQHITMLPRLVSVSAWTASLVLDGQQYALTEQFWTDGMLDCAVLLGDTSDPATSVEPRILVEAYATLRPRRKRVLSQPLALPQITVTAPEENKKPKVEVPVLATASPDPTTEEARLACDSVR